MGSLIEMKMPLLRVVRKYSVEELYDGTMDEGAPWVVHLVDGVDQRHGARLCLRLRFQQYRSGQKEKIQGLRQKPGTKQDLHVKNTQEARGMSRNIEQMPDMQSWYTVLLVGSREPLFRTEVLMILDHAHYINDMKDMASPVEEVDLDMKGAAALPQMSDVLKLDSESDLKVVCVTNESEGPPSTHMSCFTRSFT